MLRSPSRRGFASAQPLTALQHELAGFADMFSYEFAVPLNVAANDDGFHISGASAQNHSRYGVAVSIEIRSPHIDYRDVGKFARRQAADFFLHIPHTSAINRCKLQQVPLTEGNGRNPLTFANSEALALDLSAANASRISEKISVPQLQMVSTPKPHWIFR
jgi:hypothetical protein